MRAEKQRRLDFAVQPALKRIPGDVFCFYNPFSKNIFAEVIKTIDQSLETNAWLEAYHL